MKIQIQKKKFGFQLNNTMRKIIYILLFHLSLFSLAQETNLTEIENFGKNHGNLKMLIYPATNKDSIPKKLIIALHGCNQDAKRLNELTNLTSMADEYNCVILFPQQKKINNISNCFNWFRQDDFTGDEGEMSSIMEMYNYAIKNYTIDTNNVFVMGVSAGGVMSMAVAMNHPKLFKGVCSYAGGPIGVSTSTLSAIQLMQSDKDLDDKIVTSLDFFTTEKISKAPILVTFHGLDDFVVKPINSLRIMKQWLLRFYSNAKTTIQKVDTNNDLVSKQVTSINNQPIAYQYEIKGLGHLYLVDPKEEKGEKLPVNSVDINFSATYNIFKDFGIIK